jgi:hypothetical protein
MSDDLAHPLLGTQYRYDGKSGEYINQDHARIARIVNDYDPLLFLCWVPPHQRDPGNTQTYALIHQKPGQKEQIVKTFSDDEIDERVLAWVFRADTHRVDILSEVDAMNAAAELVRTKEWEDTRAEMKDFLVSVLKTPRHTYRHKGKDWLAR